MGKKNKKGRNKHREHHRIGLGTNQSSSSLKSIPSGGVGFDVCPSCGTKFSPDKELSGLTYCAHCSLFLWTAPKKKTNYSLSTTLAALKRFGGTDILFSERIPGLVSAIIPNTKEGVIEVFRRLSKPEAQSFVSSIRNDNELNEIEISLFINKVGFDQKYVIEACNALRSALNKSVISNPGTHTFHSQYILNLSSSVDDVFPGEKVKVQWSAIEDSQITYAIITADGLRRVKPNGHIWIAIDSDMEVTVKAFYRKNKELDSRTIILKAANPPVIHNLFSDISTPVMETEKVRIRWNVENAEKISLIHHYNDYERLTVDVTHHGGEFTFTALRSELIELIAERRTARSVKSLMIEVIPIPKFKVSAIPQFVGYNDIGIARIPDLTEASKTEKLFNTLKDITTLSDLAPYKSAKANLSELAYLIRNFIH